MESLSLIESYLAFAKYWLTFELVDYVVSENDNVDSDDGQNNTYVQQVQQVSEDNTNNVTTINPNPLQSQDNTSGGKKFVYKQCKF